MVIKIIEETAEAIQERYAIEMALNSVDNEAHNSRRNLYWILSGYC